jgi:peroxin-5
MQAEWEEMARRNWISENQEAQNQVTISASEKVTNSVLWMN